MAEWSQGPITLGVMSLHSFPILPFLKIFITDFSGTVKARKQKICIHVIETWTMTGYSGIVYTMYTMTGYSSIVYTGIGTKGP